jgi:hypothetical protein
MLDQSFAKCGFAILIAGFLSQKANRQANMQRK